MEKRERREASFALFVCGFLRDGAGALRAARARGMRRAGMGAAAAGMARRDAKRAGGAGRRRGQAVRAGGAGKAKRGPGAFRFGGHAFFGRAARRRYDRKQKEWGNHDGSRGFAVFAAKDTHHRGQPRGKTGCR